MKNRMISPLAGLALILSIVASPSIGQTQEAGEPRRPGFVHILGSIVFTTLHFPLKLVTCVGTQAGAAVAYTATYNVPGHYDGETNGRDIGETARRSCTGSWIVRPSQVVRDYGE
ncbi:MAG TPA: hypothetical protein VFM35_03070 [Candidatus Binatia bacterium]|nr:hypothetical protein [Candidatus Binatia bacterium]